MYKKGDFCNYITAFRVEKGCEFTHTSITKPAGAFYIPSDEKDNFWDKYKTAISNNDDLYMTEKHRDVGPVLIDLDFRFDASPRVERVYTEGIIRDIVEAYGQVISQYVDVRDSFDMYVMEKPMPVLDRSQIKDGIHIVIPDVITKPSVQHLIRKDVLSSVKNILSCLKLKNGIEDVVDEAVIERNNWQMYGSKKPNCEPYKVSYIYRFKPSDNIVETVGLGSNGGGISEADLCELLSIRNKYEESNLKIEKVPIIKAFEKERAEKMTRKQEMVIKPVTTKNTCENIEFVQKLVDILCQSRADKYDDWIRLGWCLRNIDYRLVDKWVEFSKKSNKYKDGECERLWNYMRDGLGIGTLHLWAKQDNPDEYKKILEKDLSNLIYRSRSETHNDIAKVVYFMFKYDFVCVSIKQNYWYEFRGHKWVPCDSAHTLRAKLSSEVSKEYAAAAAYYNTRATNEEMEADQQRWLEDAKKLNGIALKLKQSPFKENIIKECRDMFYVEKFEEKLDSKVHLIGFENGVYDLDMCEFRDGRPEDFLTFSTGVNFEPYDPHHACQQEIDEFLSKVLTKPEIKEYVLTLLASFLNGGIREERFHIWTGSGCHAIDTPIMMADGSLKKVQDIRVGQQLMGDDSKSRNVLQLFRGHADMYKIKPVKGDSFVVNGDHILSLKASNTDTVTDISVKEYLEYIKSSNERLYLFKAPVDFEHKNVPVDPYMFGQCLMKNDENKHIPDMYLRNIKYIRMQLLSGITSDARCYNANKGIYQVVAEDESFADDIVYLVQSLGYFCVKYKQESSYCVEFTCTEESNKVEFTVERVEDNYFFGFELDGNHRYLMGDFTVTHNSNGKSKLLELFESSFGDYCCKFPVTLLTQKRAASNAATSELARAKGKRFACLQEPSEDEKLNVGLMKELSGGDKIQARAIFREPIEFKPQFKMILTCNHLPHVPSDDGGTWRRIRVVEFTSKFTYTPDPAKVNEFMIDTDLSRKFEDWKEHFMSLLINYYSKYAETGCIKEPEDVLKCTKEYQRNNDMFLDFVEQELEKDDRGFISVNDTHSKFQSWIKENAPHLKNGTKKAFMAGMDKIMGKSVHFHKVHGWKGYSFRQDEMFGGDDMLD